MIFPVNSGYYSGDTLGKLRLTWYNNIDASKTVEIANYMKIHAEAGETIFYSIYIEAEKEAAPAKWYRTVLFLKASPVYNLLSTMQAEVWLMWKPCMTISACFGAIEKDYNAFALIYHPYA